MMTHPYESLIPCFGSRLTVGLMPTARRYRVYPLGIFHRFDWQGASSGGVNLAACPQVVSTETAQIGLRVGDVTRILPFAAGEVFAQMDQRITPLTTQITASDPALPVEATFTFRSTFYPQSFEFSAAPGYEVEIALRNTSGQAVTVEAFFGLPLPDPARLDDAGVFLSALPLDIPDGIDHAGVDGLIFEQVITLNGGTPRSAIAGDVALLSSSLRLAPGETGRCTAYHFGYIGGPALNTSASVRRFGYTTIWDDPLHVAAWWLSNQPTIRRRSALFDSTVMDASLPPELQAILAAAFKGLAANAWWAEDGWFSVMDYGAFHSALDVDYQLALFFLAYWPDLLRREIEQWTAAYKPGQGYMPHDLGQHLEATGNRYGGPEGAMQVEETCNYLLLLHAYWHASGNEAVLKDKLPLLRELTQFLLDCDTTGTGLPNKFTQSTNDWGSDLVTTSEEQSYHGVRMIAAFDAAAQMARHLNDRALERRCLERGELIGNMLSYGWLGDHFPISLIDPLSAHHYSMWTTHGLLYPLRMGQRFDDAALDMKKLRLDLMVSTAHTLREHGSAHSTADVRGWLAQNLWRDMIAAYLGLDYSGHVPRYLGHGEYVSYEATALLDVSGEIQTVPGAVAEHTHAGELHAFPRVDGHPRPACGFGLPYALAGAQVDALRGHLSFAPVVFPLKIALTHLADWEHERIPWVEFTRHTPTQTAGPKKASVQFTILTEEDLLRPFAPALRA